MKSIDLGSPRRPACIIVVKRCEIGPRLLLIINMEWHIGFQMK